MIAHTIAHDLPILRCQAASTISAMCLGFAQLTYVSPCHPTDLGKLGNCKRIAP
jgi:hypothetical protein